MSATLPDALPRDWHEIAVRRPSSDYTERWEPIEGAWLTPAEARRIAAAGRLTMVHKRGEDGLWRLVVRAAR